MPYHRGKYDCDVLDNIGLSFNSICIGYENIVNFITVNPSESLSCSEHGFLVDLWRHRRDGLEYIETRISLRPTAHHWPRPKVIVGLIFLNVQKFV